MDSQKRLEELIADLESIADIKDLIQDMKTNNPEFYKHATTVTEKLLQLRQETPEPFFVQGILTAVIFLFDELTPSNPLYGHLYRDLEVFVKEIMYLAQKSKMFDFGIEESQE